MEIRFLRKMKNKTKQDIMDKFRDQTYMDNNRIVKMVQA